VCRAALILGAIIFGKNIMEKAKSEMLEKGLNFGKMNAKGLELKCILTEIL